jgi:hypothetical protein
MEEEAEIYGGELDLVTWGFQSQHTANVGCLAGFV